MPQSSLLFRQPHPPLLKVLKNEVYFFVTDLIFLPKILIPDPKNVRILIPETAKIWSLIAMKNTADPDPTRCDSRSEGCDS